MNDVTQLLTANPGLAFLLGLLVAILLGKLTIPQPKRKRKSVPVERWGAPRK